MRMKRGETVGGEPVADEQIVAWAAEAESGYDVDALKKRGRGRPGRGAVASQVVALRLTEEEEFNGADLSIHRIGANAVE